MKIKFLILLMLISSQAWGRVLSYKDFKTLPMDQQKKILLTYRAFFSEMSAQTAVSSQEKRPSWIYLFTAAYAASDFNCFYAGWPSLLQKSGGKNYCTSPLNTNPSYKSMASACSQGQLLCQPTLFGEGLCADVSSPSLRSSAYSQCERKFEKEGRSLDSVATFISSEKSAVNADEMFATADEICTRGAQANGGMCRKLLQRVADIRAMKGERRPASVKIEEAPPQGNALKVLDDKSSSEASGEHSSEPSDFEKIFSSYLHPAPPEKGEEDKPAPSVTVPSLESAARNVATLGDVVKTAGQTEECEDIPFSRVVPEIENACQMRTGKDGYEQVSISECKPGSKMYPGGFSVRQGKEHPLYPKENPYGSMSGPYRTFNIFTGNGALNSTYLYLEEMAGGPDSHDVKSVMILLPRKTVPQVFDQGDTVKFILPTGESLIMDKKTHAIVGGVIKEGPQDLNMDRFKRKPPNFQYAGTGISVRVDHRYLSPMEGATTATVTQGDKKCSVPASALFANGEIKSTSDAEFVSAINANCKGMKFNL